MNLTMAPLHCSVENKQMQTATTGVVSCNVAALQGFHACCNAETPTGTPCRDVCLTLLLWHGQQAQGNTWCKQGSAVNPDEQL